MRGTVAGTGVSGGLCVMIATGVMDLGAFVDRDGVLQATLGLTAVYALAVLWSLYWLRDAQRRQQDRKAASALLANGGRPPLRRVETVEELQVSD